MESTKFATKIGEFLMVWECRQFGGSRALRAGKGAGDPGYLEKCGKRFSGLYLVGVHGFSVSCFLNYDVSETWKRTGRIPRHAKAVNSNRGIMHGATLPE
ncbi:MAG: hypothetical protein WC637_21550 [Victivallales bacterium]|jgi:hypothetical protein